ncbi:uncharacterized protein LOC141719851 isoform X2 [Apium graveolens]|uniref:uncharacterized protein LOC141719851 isoform X2 n=1 Tax=Apium graveolens TaxID=4045 RepID=UPI003D79B1B6
MLIFSISQSSRLQLIFVYICTQSSKIPPFISSEGNNYHFISRMTMHVAMHNFKNSVTPMQGIPVNRNIFHEAGEIEKSSRRRSPLLENNNILIQKALPEAPVTIQEKESSSIIFSCIQKNRDYKLLNKHLS